MTRDEIYQYARSKGCSIEKATELSIANAGKKTSDVEELGALAIAVPVMGAIVVDEALGGIPSSIVGGILDIFF